MLFRYHEKQLLSPERIGKLRIEGFAPGKLIHQNLHSIHPTLLFWAFCLSSRPLNFSLETMKSFHKVDGTNLNLYNLLLRLHLLGRHHC